MNDIIPVYRYGKKLFFINKYTNSLCSDDNMPGFDSVEELNPENILFRYIGERSGNKYDVYFEYGDNFISYIKGIDFFYIQPFIQSFKKDHTISNINYLYERIFI